MDVKRLVLAGVRSPQIAETLGRPKAEIQRICRDPAFQKSVLDTKNAINDPIDKQMVVAWRQLRNAINEEAPRAFQRLVDMVYAETPEELQAAGLEAPLPVRHRIEILQSIVDRSPEGTPPKKFNIKDEKLLGFADPVMAKMAYELMQSRRAVQQPALHVTPEEGSE